jgi:hypothetical protein
MLFKADAYLAKLPVFFVRDIQFGLQWDFCVP